MVLDFFLTIILLTAILGLLVFVHEAGHFMAAKLLRVEVEEFAFGFGRNILSKEYKETVYKINLLPFGGYVKMLGDEDPSSFVRKYGKNPSIKEKKSFGFLLKKIGADKGSMQSRLKTIKNSMELDKDEKEKLTRYMWNYVIPHDKDNLDNKSFLQRIFVMIAGVTMNMILAFIVFSIYFAISNYKTDFVYIAKYPFIGADANVYDRPVINKVYSTDLQNQGLKADQTTSGLVVMSINDIQVNDLDKYFTLLDQFQGQKVDLHYIDIDNQKEVDKKLVLNTSSFDTNVEARLDKKIIFYSIVSGSPAEKAGLKVRDILVQIDGKDTTFEKSTDFVTYLEANQGKQKKFTILRDDGSLQELKVNLKTKADEKDIILGAQFLVHEPSTASLYHLDYSKNKTFAGIAHSINLVGFTPVAFVGLIKASVETKDATIAANSVSSIWGVGENLNRFVVNRDYADIINLVGLVSVALATMNILPIPLLDGGQVLFIVLEKIRKKPLSVVTQEKIAQIAFMILVVFSILIVLKDIWIGFIGDFFRNLF